MAPHRTACASTAGRSPESSPGDGRDEQTMALRPRRASFSKTDTRQIRRSVTCAGRRLTIEEVADLAQIFLREFDCGGAKILLEILAASCPESAPYRRPDAESKRARSDWPSRAFPAQCL